MPWQYYECGHMDSTGCLRCLDYEKAGRNMVCKDHAIKPQCFDCRKGDEANKFKRVKSSLTEHDQFVIKWHYNWDTGEKLENPPKDMMDLRGLVDDKAKLDKMLEALKNRRTILREKRLREIDGNPLLWQQTSKSG